MILRGAPPGAPSDIVLDTTSVGLVEESGEGVTLWSFLGDEDGVGGLDTEGWCSGFAQILAGGLQRYMACLHGRGVIFCH
jgi:hypothetical protein